MVKSLQEKRAAKIRSKIIFKKPPKIDSTTAKNPQKNTENQSSMDSKEKKVKVVDAVYILSAHKSLAQVLRIYKNSDYHKIIRNSRLSKKF